MNNVEIELKLAAKSQAVEVVRLRLNELAKSHTEPKRLVNTYFDTVDKLLRRWDMGLRVRSCEGRYEMTLKTAGKITGGLHQRPEYNVELGSSNICLNALPERVWPEDTDVNALQNSLKMLFTTNFHRETWLIEFGDSEIEVAFDQGEIAADERTLPLLEFEFELKKGSVIDIFGIVKKFNDINGLRLSERSKAARGYMLATDDVLCPAASNSSVFDYSFQPIEHALAELMKLWQIHEERWLARQPQAEVDFQTFFLSVQSFLVHYRHSSPQFIRDIPLMMIPESIVKLQGDADAFCYHENWLRCKLAFTQWLSALNLP